MSGHCGLKHRSAVDAEYVKAALVQSRQAPPAVKGLWWQQTAGKCSPSAPASVDSPASVHHQPPHYLLFAPPASQNTIPAQCDTRADASIGIRLLMYKVNAGGKLFEDGSQLMQRHLGCKRHVMGKSQVCNDLILQEPATTLNDSDQH